MRKIINKLYFRVGQYRFWFGAHGIVGFESPTIGFGWDHCLIECGRLGFWFRAEREGTVTYR